METLILVILGIVALVVTIFLIKYLFIGTLFLFGWSSEQGFIGVAVYFACWIMLFPFMLAACIISGAAISWSQ